jgi:DNA-binding response OmpR family regulator
MTNMKKNVLALLLDETPLSKAILSRTFEQTGYEFLWTADVNEALEALVRQRVDLLLVDLNRPLRNEWEMFERLIARNHGVPILLLTEHKSAYEEAAAEHVGAVLQKPFSSTELMQAAASLLGPPSPGVAVSAHRGADLSEATAKAEEFHKMMHERYTTPLTLPSPHRYWGINE